MLRVPTLDKTTLETHDIQFKFSCCKQHFQDIKMCKSKKKRLFKILLIKIKINSLSLHN